MQIIQRRVQFKVSTFALFRLKIRHQMKEDKQIDNTQGSKTGSIHENIDGNILYSNGRSTSDVLNARRLESIDDRHIRHRLDDLLNPRLVSPRLYPPTKAGRDQIATPEREVRARGFTRLTT